MTHRAKRIDIEVLDRDRVFPHDVAAMVKLTAQGKQQLIEKLQKLKPGAEFVVGDGDWQQVAFVEKRNGP